MYEELYAPLPDSGLYLERIGYRESIEHTLETVSGLVFTHQKSVPFENYDICELGRPISLATERLYDKIIIKRRGGYCYELNAGFAALLTALGFEVWPALARVYSMPSGEQPMPPTHRISLVIIEGKKYFADVGFGGAMPAGALLLEEGAPQEIRGDVYHFEKRPYDRWILYRDTGAGVAEPMVGFAEAPSEPVDFVSPNYFSSTHPDSLFTRSRIANIRFDDGFASITDGKFHLARGGSDLTVPIESWEQESGLLREHFGIVLK